MNEVKKVTVGPIPPNKYKWEELEVGEGYPNPHPATQYRARDYCLRRGLDWTFGSRLVEVKGEKVLHIVRLS
jgi:hypothetical protein